VKSVYNKSGKRTRPAVKLDSFLPLEYIEVDMRSIFQQPYPFGGTL